MNDLFPIPYIQGEHEARVRLFFNLVLHNIFVIKFYELPIRIVFLPRV